MAAPQAVPWEDVLGRRRTGPRGEAEASTPKAPHALAGDVKALKAEKRELQHRLAEASTPEALQQEARRLGLVRPGERLFIVKGITAWLHSNMTRAR
jgi:hypothetical protein